jgi:hypothetical protein
MAERSDRIGVAVEAVEEERLRVPSWFGEAVWLCCMNEKKVSL